MTKLINIKRQATTVISSILLASALSVFASSATAAELSIKINKIEKIQGHLLVALYKGKEAYDSDKSEIAQKVEVTSNEHLVTFKDLPEGDYAVKLYHDENDNNKMDTNMLGIPKEGYGFSNNGGRYGAPSYEEAQFKFAENGAIEISLL